MLKVAVVGLGGIAQKAYLPVFAEMENIEVHLYTRDAQKLKHLSEKYRFDHYHQCIHSMIESGVNAAFVHSSTASHPEVIRTFLAHHIPVYVDKPIADNLAEVEELTRLAKEQDTLLMTGFNRRYAPKYQELKALTETNMIIMQKNRASQPGEPRTFIYDDFIHVIDTVRFLLDTEIEQLNVFPVWQDELLASVTVQITAGDKVATAIMNRDSGVNEERLAVMTPSAKYEVENVTETHIYEGTTERFERFGDWETTLYKRGFVSIIQAFLTAVRNGEKAPISKEDALETHRLAEEILRKLEN
ncbi:Gfo/Idh/MocA family oxidoreductase [Listeria cossartiae subsp. cayugensis]|uniref:Gfo/Idh/MocA family oxidoreductase n=1 Tax=Listeria cossartiae subsp. cayugensis TaxID=2713505 RepID=A0ABU2IN02_9LIST|nr:Gfo/Idh/MocA family oxidoreductase [Listeria cossartiae]MDT0049565.1 Gfo/Idh/MocA family oxidoreductase [Listeria cossartiae subsp. cayugensis]MDT0066068.1 Gfo/Idh/MocA family oxidoreductase [Listeria cossartiae subsp. cayugensis]MDT0079957.1 Gfo/Idh/MocA family oxidoreductase [Listeria cossartiae subsp. cayugensis]MDT0083264.1 Gfo/Idh/MocA family oxidoreductase [Listeria cossartiae subsp. cayugensis]MDT0088644.1 Gfo/Idh/MocA family oxidoreductase [Listeria cossartiae subsp. cayugensis]